MQELLTSIDLDALWAILWPLLAAWIGGTLTPVAMRRAAIPLLCLVGRGVRALASRTAQALRRQPDPEIARLRETVEKLIRVTVALAPADCEPINGHVPPPHASACEDANPIERVAGMRRPEWDGDSP